MSTFSRKKPIKKSMPLLLFYFSKDGFLLGSEIVSVVFLQPDYVP